ncbi:MAG: hypothetical protein IJ486_03840, partial [Firmicutes bacterium]|nr:hypothetical protein [Bacillota bacterium]
EAVEKKLYTLPDCETSHDELTKKADRLIVERKQENAASYYQLSLEAGKGLVLTVPDPEVQVLTQKIVCVDVWTRKRTCLSSGEQLTRAITLLRDLRNTVTPASAVELEEAVSNAMHITLLTVNYELGEKKLSFSEDFDLIWEEGSKEVFRIPDPEPIRQFVASVTDGVRNKETAGEPFATVDTPWEWCANLTANAVSTAEVFACLNVTSYGNTTSVSATNGFLPMDSLQRLIPILNRIPEDAISTEGNIISEYDRFQCGDQIEGSCSVSLIDGINQMAVSIRSYKGSVEMILTTDLDTARSNNYQKLNTPATIWTIRDPSLRAFLDDVRENPPVINYSVGAEYNWQDPIRFEKDGFSLELYLIEDWVYEEVKNATNSGIRCRPKDAEAGWIYFSFWPDGYSREEEGLHYEERTWNTFPTTIAYPSGVLEELDFVTSDDIWSFEMVNTDVGDFTIINDGADDWFAEYVDQIRDTLTLLSFATES